MMLSGLRILLAEDNPTNQLVAVQMLENLGASVVLAVDGAEALEIVRREPFDLALVDIEMPRVTGIEFIRTVRGSSGALADLPMIALTAYVMREHQAAIATAGADGVIAKPILSIEQFGADIRRLMRQRTGAADDAEEGAGPAGELTASAIDSGIYDALAEAIGPKSMIELLGKVDADIRSARDRFRIALDPMELSEIRTVTHILISVAGAVGAVHVQNLARKLNSAGHANDTVTIRRDAEPLMGEIARTLEFIQNRLDG